MKVLVTYSGDIGKASTKYRITQYVDYLRDHGVELDFVPRKKIDRKVIAKLPAYEVVHNQRSLINLWTSWKMTRKNEQVIFDFDDAIYTRPGEPYSWYLQRRVGRRLRYWIESAKVVTTANHFLAGYARQFSSAVRVIPNAVDLTAWMPKAHPQDERFRIGWVGAPVNIPNIESLDPVLSALKRKYPFVQIAIYSGAKPKLSFAYDYHPFQPGREPEFVQSIDIGLLPLAEDDFSLGKSPIKAIQYLACGVAIVGNPMGATREILNDTNSISVRSRDDWYDALELLIKDRERVLSLAKTGREFAETHHDLRNTAKQRLDVFTAVASGQV